MNLLCPNCGKMLTVPEQYAGQLMKCPLCSGTFTVPALPPGGALEPPPAPPPAPAFQPSSEPDPYHLQQSGPPQPAFNAAREPAVKNEPAPRTPSPSPEPAFSSAPPPPPLSATGPSQPPPPSRPIVPGDYQHHFAIPISEKIIQWVPVGALVLVFILQMFFPWVGIYVGNTALATQGPWGAALAMLDAPKKNLNKEFSDYLNRTSKEIDEENKGKTDPVRDPHPNISPLMVFYVLLFLPTLLVTIAVAVVPFIKVPFPPPVQQVLPWKWAIVAGLNAIVLLFLALQMLLNFSLENSVSAHVYSHPDLKTPRGKESEDDVYEARREMHANMVQRTVWLKLAFALHVLGTAAAALTFWVDKRGPSQPPPAVELKW